MASIVSRPQCVNPFIAEVIAWMGNCILNFYVDIISYPLFAGADTGIYPHAASQYHARPKAKRGNAMLSVEKFPYLRK